jgi:hypothetical protein
VPLATKFTGANRHDVTQLIPLIDAIPPIRGKAGAPLHVPEQVMGDRGYDSDPHRMMLSCRGIASEIARRNTPRTAVAWESSDTWWSRRSRCCISSVGCARVSTSATISTRRS